MITQLDTLPPHATHVVKNSETGSIVSDVGTEWWAKGLAGFMNAEHQTNAYVVEEYKAVQS